MANKASAVLDAGDDLPLTIGTLIRTRAREIGDRVLLSGDARLTYAEAEARSRVLARGLLAAGVTKGAHVGLFYPNGPDFLISLLAVARIGAVVLPFSTLSTADELRWLLANSDTAYLLISPTMRGHDTAKLLQAAVPELDLSRPPPLRSLTTPWLKRVWFGAPVPEGIDAGWSVAALDAQADTVDEAYLAAVEARVSPADRAVIIHTSGSTASPKGVILGHGPMIRNRNNLSVIRGFGETDALFSFSPWFWIAGFSYCLLGTMIAGARLVYTNAQDANDILDVLERERPTLAIGYAQGAAKIAAHPSFARRDLSSIRYGNLYPLMAPELRPRDPGLRHEPYGLTESCGSATSTPDENDLPDRLRGSNGPLAPGFEGKIVDLEDGHELGAWELGELWLRGPFMMEGYYGKPHSAAFDKDGWYHTGDIGLISDEGFFFLKGRLSTMIKTSGANVSPREVEQVLTGLVGGRPCVVLGVPDPARGQAVAAVVIADAHVEIDEAAIRQQLHEKISSFKVPRRILRFAQAEMPLVSSGKLNLAKLTEMVQARW